MAKSLVKKKPTAKPAKAKAKSKENFYCLSIGDHLLYRGDAMDILPRVKADMLLVDPPYKLNSGGKSGLMRGAFDPKNYNNNGSIVECEIDWPEFMPLMFDALRGNAHAYIMANNLHIANCENAAKAAGFRIHNWLVWDKVNATANRWYMKNCEFVGFFFKGKAKTINDMSAKQLISYSQIDESAQFVAPDANGKRNPHPTEKPVGLMRYYIEQSTNRHEVVLDPFMGSGSTGVAAIKAGRIFIGIEKNPRWFDAAAKRIERAYKEHGDAELKVFEPQYKTKESFL